MSVKLISLSTRISWKIRSVEFSFMGKFTNVAEAKKDVFKILKEPDNRIKNKRGKKNKRGQQDNLTGQKKKSKF